MVADMPANADKPLVRWFPQIVEISSGMVSFGNPEVVSRWSCPSVPG